MKTGFARQLDILVDRNLAIHCGAAGTSTMMLLQAAVIGGFIGLAWKGQQPLPETYFVMAVAAVWMGCMNACTAVVQERAVYERERMFDLDIRAYLGSKLAVLAAAALLQTALLLAAQDRLLHLKGGALNIFLQFSVLAASNLCSAALGLLVSCCSRTSYGAVVTVPILLIPQILFSRMILGRNVEHGLTSVVEKLTITKWAHESLTNMHSGWEWGVQAKSFGALAAGTVALTVLAWLKLKVDE